MKELIGIIKNKNKLKKKILMIVLNKICMKLNIKVK